MKHNCGIVDDTDRDEEDAVAVRICGCDSVERGEEGAAIWWCCW